MSETIYIINDRLVASEIIDSEAVIINLSDGMYYTMDRVGSDVWHLFNQGCTLEYLVSAVASHYDKKGEDIADELETLLKDLLSNQLVTTLDGNSQRVHPTVLSEKGEFMYVTPSLNCYSDMNEVLALDPPLPEISARGCCNE